MYKRNSREDNKEVNESKEEKRIKEAASIGKKKWVRYKEGAVLYSMGIHTFMDLAMLENDICKTFQIFALRDYLKEHETITKMELIRILNENAPINENNRFQKITITRERLKDFFPVFYTKSQMETVLFQLLTEWKKQNQTEE